MPVILNRTGCLILVRGWDALDQHDLAPLTETIDAYIAKREKFLVVGDALQVRSISPSARRFVGEHRRGLAETAQGFDLGLVLALASPLVRGAITAISWFAGELGALRTVESRPELARAVREQLSARQVQIDHAAESALDSFVAPRPPRT